MKNIFNILKYNFGKYNSGINKILYIILLVILIFSTCGTFIRVPFVAEVISVMNIAFVSLFLVVNFIVSLIKFSSQISKDKGKLIFTLPIKSWEFIIAKYIEFIILQGIIALIVYVITSFTRNSMAGALRVTALATAYGTTIAYIIITSFIVIFSSYIKNLGLCILAVIIGGGIIQGFVSKINWLITKLFPYVYIEIGSFIEIDIISSLLWILWMVILVITSINHLDKKLDII